MKHSFFDYDSHRLYYCEQGAGEPLLLLHGNTVSSNIFAKDIPFFAEHFRVIAFDYPGHGKSSRILEFPDNFWHYNARCALALLAHLSLDTISVIGTSGGALVGLNMCTIQPNSIRKIVADSFFGNGLSIEETKRIVAGRNKSQTNFLMRQYWAKQAGPNWKRIVDADNDMLLRFAQNQAKAIIGNLNTITAKVLITASRQDKIVPDIEKKLKDLAAQIPNAELKIFDTGKHTFMITKREIFRPLALNFLKKNKIFYL